MKNGDGRINWDAQLQALSTIHLTDDEKWESWKVVAFAFVAIHVALLALVAILVVVVRLIIGPEAFAALEPPSQSDRGIGAILFGWFVDMCLFVWVFQWGRNYQLITQFVEDPGTACTDGCTCAKDEDRLAR